MALRPLGDRLIIKPAASEEKTAGGIVLPDTAKEKPQEGEVIAVGPGRTLDNGLTAALEINVGDRIMYAKYGGTEIRVDGQDYVILRQDDVLAIR